MTAPRLPFAALVVLACAAPVTVGACRALLAGPHPPARTTTHRPTAARGHQQNRSLIAIGSGQITKRATTTRDNFTPEHHTDVIVAVKTRTVSADLDGG
jgi:cell division protein FtsW (lipid II flippase)